jgi:serine/threonine protein kinase
MSSTAHSIEKSEGFLNLRGLVLDTRFEVERRLTRGSYSEIHLARNLSPQLDEPNIVIVKALNLLFQEEQDADLERTLIENIALEAQTLSYFHHENIVRLFSYGRALDHEGRQFYYLVLEHMPGGNLDQYCRNNPLTFEQILDYTAQICAALSYAHALDVIHRDVKPSNIMLSADRRKVKMLDFGVARHESNDNGLMTKVGTALYAAPEHFSLSHLRGTKLTPAADVYALAKCVYFMLCGKPPYEFRQQQITSLPAQVEAQAWAGELLRVLFKATCEKASDRYQTAQEFYLALQAITEQTIHSTRGRPQATFNRKNPHLRLVIDVIHKERRTFGSRLKALRGTLTVGARGLAALIKNGSRMAFGQTRPVLLNSKTGLINLRQSVSQYLRRLPGKLVLRITLVIIVCSILLIATPQLIKHWRSQPSSLPAQQAEAKTTLEKTETASTDINIRSAPNRKASKVGLVERDSKVRILSFSKDQKWCEIEILQHGRAKEDVSAMDRGWVYAKTLR